MTVDKFSLWNQAMKASTKAKFALFSAKMEIKNFKRDFLHSILETLTSIGPEQFKLLTWNFKHLFFSVFRMFWVNHFLAIIIFFPSGIQYVFLGIFPFTSFLKKSSLMANLVWLRWKKKLIHTVPSST